MSINISCVQCHKQYSVSEQFEGRAVRCKNCGATFVVHSPAAEPAASDLGIDLNDVLGETSTSTQASQPAGSGGYGNSPAQARSPASGNRKLWIGLGIGGGVLALLLIGVVFVVSAVKKQVRRAEVRKMMQDPQWRERVLGEKQGWQMYTDSSPVYGFSVELPNPPIKQHQGFAAGGTQWIVMAHRDKETFSVVTVRPAMGIDSGQSEQLRNSANQVAAGMKARVTSQRPVTLGEFAGTEFDYESLAGQKSFSGRIRLFATSNMLFQVGWMASPRAAVTDDVARFLDSFSLPETAESPREPLRMPGSVLERPGARTV